MRTTPPAPGAKQFLFCFIGLQASYLTWGYVQDEKLDRCDLGVLRHRRDFVSIRPDDRDAPRPSATFCVFSNRVLAVTVAWAVTMYKHGGKLNILRSGSSCAVCPQSHFIEVLRPVPRSPLRLLLCRPSRNRQKSSP